MSEEWPEDEVKQQLVTEVTLVGAAFFILQQMLGALISFLTFQALKRWWERRTGEKV